MKWKFELTLTLTALTQMLLLFFSWLGGWLVSDHAPLFLSIGVLTIGIVGGMTNWILNYSEQEESPVLDKFILIVEIVLLSIGVYFVIIPVMLIFDHGYIAASIFVLGGIVPRFIPGFISSMGKKTPDIVN